jgi:hypothetical protein
MHKKWQIRFADLEDPDKTRHQIGIHGWAVRCKIALFPIEAVECFQNKLK